MSVGLISADTIDSLYSAAINSQDRLDQLANFALSQGIDFYQKGNYDRAITAFKRSVGLSPSSDNSAKAYDYLAQAYLKQNNTDAAITTYQKAITIYPTYDYLHINLGKIYYDTAESDKALDQYKTAVQLDPNSADNRYSLGQSYLNSGQLSDAREQFIKVTNISPNSATGYYGLGEVARKSGDYHEAILQLNKAIAADKNFNNSYLELGYTYTDIGNIEKAGDLSAILSAKGSSLSSTLQAYISQSSKPKVTMVLTNGFDTTKGPQTSVSDLDASLSSPDSSKFFSMNFIFSKDMDSASVQNPYNWSITRATITNGGGVYNGGLTPPETEVTILPIPEGVSYDSHTRTATVQFKINQNATGDGTIDPEHIVFKFVGIDAYKKAMDTSADQYSGFSGVV
jgi:Tfp pilus assembly protein PilF